jgi:membrane fusion protein, epimerase transport system
MTVIPGEFARVPGAPESPKTAPSNARPYVLAGLLVLIISFGVFGTWSALAPLEGAVVTAGQVKVQSRRQVIQHLEGGIVSEILVSDGDHVTSGQLLVRLSDISPAAQLRIVRLQYFAALALEARLKAERSELDEIDFPDELLAEAERDEKVLEMVEAEQEVFAARRSSYQNEREILQRRIEQLREQIIGVEGLLVAQTDRIVSYRQEVAEWQRLFEAKLADKVRLLQLRRELAELEGEHASTQARLAELRIGVGEAEANLVLRRQTLLSEVTALLAETRSTLADLSTRLLALEDTLARTDIRAPVDGVIVDLQVRTIGAVISPGVPVMELVPASDDFVVIANVIPSDIDSVRVGQPADIRFSAFDLRYTHVIPATVVKVSADTMEDPQTGMQFYEVELKVDEAGIGQMASYGIALVPGMPAEVLVKTGGRTLLNFLLKPFLDMVARAFRER